MRKSHVDPLLVQICEYLSLVVVLTCVVLKLPQLLKVVKAKSVEGISIRSVLLELCGYTILLTYSFAKGFPPANYFEYTFLVFQDIILLLLICYYKNSLDLSLIAYGAVYCAGALSMAANVLPAWVMTLEISLVTPISASSKLVQLWAMFQSKDAGQVSFLTWALAFATCIVRAFTSVILTGDPALLTTYAVSTTLNAVLAGTVLYYGDAKKKKS